MKILNSTRDDFDKIVINNQLSEAIKNSNGRTIMGEAVINKDTKYSGITDVELLKSFGSDMITLKKYNYKTNNINTYSDLKNCSALVGLNYELKVNDFEVDSLTDESIKVLDNNVDYVVLTVYEHTNLSFDQLEKHLKLVRENYEGFILLNYYISDVDYFYNETLKRIDLLTKYRVNALSIPCIYTKPGICQKEVVKVVKKLRENNILSFSTICTSQEDSSTSVVELIALKAKEIGFDGHLIGDAASSMISDEQNIYNYSVAIRGRRHTYFRMSK